MSRCWICIALLTIIALAAISVVLAQDEGGQAPPPDETQAAPAEKTEAAPAEKAEPAAPKPEPVLTPEKLLAPGLYRQLAELWGPVRKGMPPVTAPGNVTVLSVPVGAAVYIASVEEIRDATSPEGGAMPVEDVVFTETHYAGVTPLTVTLEAKEYVLALRAPAREAGFDGGCVSKTTTDVITGGKRHTYRLYPLRKKAGQYTCFVASFIGPQDGPQRIGTQMLERGTYEIPADVLAAELAQTTGVPVALRPTICTSLNTLGLAYYQRDEQFYLVKATLIGSTLRVEEWPAE